MAFVRVAATHRQRSMPGESVTMGLYLADGKTVQRKSVGFRLSRALLDKLGWAGDTTTTVSVYEGVGEDVGFWQIAPDKDGYKLTPKREGKSRDHGRSFLVNAASFKHYVLNDPGPLSAKTVAHFVEDGRLLIECPNWLKFNPQSVQDGAAHKTHVVPPPPTPSVVVPSTMRSSPHVLEMKRPRGRPRKDQR